MKRKWAFALLSFLVVFWGNLYSVFPCTTFMLRNSPTQEIGKSYDWHVGAGLILVNKRNVAKKSFFLHPNERRAHWISKYGSVTFNQYGREFPLAGMNEAGLVVEILMLPGTRYPLPDDNPAVNELQWIQYQLDNFGSVQEFVEHADQLRISPLSARVHFMLCDRSSKCATVDYLNRQQVIHTTLNGEGEMPLAVLTNNSYRTSRNVLPEYKPFGGEKEVPRAGTDSLDRFVRTAFGVYQFLMEPSDAPLKYAFDLLQKVRNGNFTKWQVVYQPNHQKVYFRTNFGRREISRIATEEFDYNCQTPVQMFHINAEGTAAGEINQDFIPYDVNLDRKVLKRALKPIGNPLPPEAVEAILFYSSTTECS